MSVSKKNDAMIFDFSQEAQGFKQRLWSQLQERQNSAIEQLEDDDLAWINAAGPVHLPPEPDDIL